MTIEQRFRDALGGVASRTGVLVGREQLNLGKILFHHFEKPLLAVLGAGGADLITEQDDVALAAEQLPEIARRDPAALAIVGGDKAHGRLRIERGVDDDHRDLTAGGGLDRSHEAAAIERGENDRADPLADEILDDLHLRLAVILLQRTLPDHVHRDALGREFALRLDRAGVDRLPELVGGPFRNDGNPVGFGRGGDGDARDGQRQETEKFLHGGLENSWAASAPADRATTKEFFRPDAVKRRKNFRSRRQE